VFHQLNGFDATFFAHQEEIDLCWRAFNAGHITKYTPKSTVYHVGGATLNEGNPMKTYLNFRNSLLMLTKNLPKDKLFFVLLLRLFMDGLAGIQFIFKGKFKHCLAIVHAHFAFYKLAKIYYFKRNNLQKQNYYKVSSIVFFYFLKNGKKFAELF
jgi:GT2 family glycosyltransferase